jgi:hypothetical protein
MTLCLPKALAPILVVSRMARQRPGGEDPKRPSDGPRPLFQVFC